MIKGNIIKSLAYLLIVLINLLSMTSIASYAPIAIDIMKPTWKELTDYLLAVHELISHQVLYIKGYKVKKFELMYCDFEHAKIMRCIQIAYEFKTKYPKFKF